MRIRRAASARRDRPVCPGVTVFLACEFLAVGATRTRRLALAAALGGAATGVLFPEHYRVADRFPFVDVVAWRPHAALAALVTSAALATRTGTRPAAVAVGSVAAAGLGAVARREIGRSSARRMHPAGPAPGSTEFTVLTFNALRGRADTGELATVIERAAPDFVVLPEAGSDFRDKLMPLIDVLGYRSWLSTPDGTGDGESVTLLVADRVGDVRVRQGTSLWLPHVEATGGLLGERTLYAVHPIAPVRPSRTAAWRRDLVLLASWTRAAGTADRGRRSERHVGPQAAAAALGGCRSAAGGRGRGLVGTFPASLPRWFGIQIDHILIPGTPRPGDSRSWTSPEVIIGRSWPRSPSPPDRLPAAAIGVTSSITI